MPFFRLGKRSQQYNVNNKSLFVIPIELLTNEAIECTLFASSLGQEALNNVCQKIGLLNAEYFGLLFRNARKNIDQWVDLGRPLKKQLDKYGGSGGSEVRLFFRLQYFVPNFNFLADEITRYHYFCAMKGMVIEGRLSCSREDAILLASFSLQAEFGDYTPERHTVEYLNNFALFPKSMVATKVTNDLLVECAIAAYRNLQGVPTNVAEIYYISEAQQKDGHGQEGFPTGFPARDLDTGQEVALGVCIRGIFVVNMHEQQQMGGRRVELFRWNDIANLMHNKKVFVVERGSTGPTEDGSSSVPYGRKNYATFDPEYAAAIWRCAVEQHQYFMKGLHWAQQQNMGGEAGYEYAGLTSLPVLPFLSHDFFLGYDHFLMRKNALAAQIAPTLAAATAAAVAASTSVSAAGMDGNSSLVEQNGLYSNIPHHLYHLQPRSSVSTGSLYETIKSTTGGNSSSSSSIIKQAYSSTVDVNSGLQYRKEGNGSLMTNKVPTPKQRSSTEPIELHHIALQNCSSNGREHSKSPEISGAYPLSHPPTAALTYTQKKLQSKTAAAAAAITSTSNGGSPLHHQGTVAPIYENQLRPSDLTFEQRKKLLPPYKSPPDYAAFIKRKAAAAAASTTMASLSQSMGSIPNRLASQSHLMSPVNGVSSSASSTSLVGGSNGVGPRGANGITSSSSMMSMPYALQQQQQQQIQHLYPQQYGQYQPKNQSQQNFTKNNNVYSNYADLSNISGGGGRGSLPPPELPPRSILNHLPPAKSLSSGGGLFTASSPELNNLNSLFQKQQQRNNQHIMQMQMAQQQQHHQHVPLKANGTAIRSEVPAQPNSSSNLHQLRPCFTSVPDLTFRSGSTGSQTGYGVTFAEQPNNKKANKDSSFFNAKVKGSSSFFAAFPGKNLRIFRSQHTTGSVPNLASTYNVPQQTQQLKATNSKSRRSTEVLNWGYPQQQQQQQRSNSITILEQQPRMFNSYSISGRIDEAPELAAAAVRSTNEGISLEAQSHTESPGPTNVYSPVHHHLQNQNHQQQQLSKGPPNMQHVIYANIGGPQEVRAGGAPSQPKNQQQYGYSNLTDTQQNISNGGLLLPQGPVDANRSTSSAVITPSANTSTISSNNRPPSSSQSNPIPTNSRIIVFDECFHDQDFTREFELLPRMNPTAKFTTASLPENVLRNRFRDILPYEENRVKITPTKDNKHGYINASHVYMKFGSMQQHYIAAQGPLPATTLDFWAMIFEHSISIICMVTNFTESGVGKCYSYLPLSPEPGMNTIKFGDYEIICNYVTSTSTFITSFLTVVYGGQKRSVTHLRYTDWNDHSIPGDIHGFLSFLSEMDAIHRRSTREGSGLGFKLKTKLLQKKNTSASSTSLSPASSPILVHCSAGAGRSGVVILCDALLKYLDHNFAEPIDIPRALIQLRFQRMISVQHCEQFRFCCQVLNQSLSNSRLI